MSSSKKKGVVHSNSPSPAVHGGVATRTLKAAVVDLALARVQSLRQDRPHGGAQVLRSCHLPPLGVADIVGGSRAAALAGLLRATLHLPATLHSGTLVLSGCGVDAADLHQIGDVLDLCPHIHVLDLRDTPLTPHFVRGLLQLLEKHSAVTEVLLDEPDPPTAAGSSDTVASLLGDIRAQIVRNDATERARREAHESALHCRATVAVERAHAKQLQALMDAETTGREAVIAEESTEMKNTTQQEHSAKIHLNSLLRRRVQAIQQKRLLDAVAEREATSRSAVEAASLLELLLLVEADCGIQRKLVHADVESAIRALLKKEEVASWVLARRREKARFQEERLAREQMQEEEEASRRGIHEAYWAACAVVEGEMEQHAALAKSAEHARVEKARRDEAARKRLEDQARERAEKEEAQRQKALREFHSKQQQAREKLDTDATTVRKGLRTIEAALSGALFRIAASWFAVVLAREELDRAAHAYATLLQESPQASLTVHHWSPGSSAAAPPPSLSPKHARSPAHSAAQSPRRFEGEPTAPVPHVFVMEDTEEMLEVMGPPNARSSHVPPWPANARGDFSEPAGEPVIRISLPAPVGGGQNTDEVASPVPPTDPASAVSQPTPTATAESAKLYSAHRLVRFHCGMRDTWLSSTKAAQQEFKQRCSKLEAARQAAKGKCAEELKALRSAIAQHRLELGRWKWPPLGILANTTLLPPSTSGGPHAHSSSSVSPVTSPKHIMNVSLGTAHASEGQTAFVAPEPLADPLNLSLPLGTGAGSTVSGGTVEEGAPKDEDQGPDVLKPSHSNPTTPPTAAPTAFHQWIDEAILEFCSYGVHHRWLLQTIPSFVDDGNPFAAVGLVKELPVATLRSWKEAVSSCTVEVWLEAGPPLRTTLEPSSSEATPAEPRVSFELLRFDLPREDHEWVADVQTNDVRGAAAGLYGNPFLFAPHAAPRHAGHGSSPTFRQANALLSYRHASTMATAAPQSLHHHHAPVDSLTVLQASLRVRRVELEQAADAAREAGAAAEVIDYTTIAAAKQCMEQWNVTASAAQSLRQMLVSDDDADPGSRDAQVLASRGPRLHFLARQFPSWAPVCRRVSLTYAARAASTTSEAPVEVLPQQQGGEMASNGETFSQALLTAAPSCAGFGADASSTQAAGSGVQPSGLQQLQSSVLCADVADFLSSVDYYASSGCDEGCRAVRYRVEMSFELDLTEISHVFSVIRRLRSGSAQTTVSSSSVSHHTKQFGGAIPIVALRPRGLAAASAGSLSAATSVWNSVVLSRVDVPTAARASSLPSTGLLPGHSLPPAFPDQRRVADNAKACLPVAHIGVGSTGSAETGHCAFASHFLGFELVVAYTPLFRPALPTGQVELQLCFMCDSRLWFSVPDASLRRDRSPLGTIYYSGTGDGLHPVALLDVLHGALVCTGTPPLSATSSSSAVSAKKAMSRKSLSGAMMAAAARKSTTGAALSSLASARSEQRVTCSMRVESTLVEPRLLADVCSRFAFATQPGTAPTLPPLQPPSATAGRSSNPATPRTDLPWHAAAGASAIFKAEVTLRPPVVNSPGLVDPASASVNCTPREEAAAASGLLFSPTPLPLPQEWLLHPRLLRDTPLAHCTVEVVPTWAPQSAAAASSATDAPATLPPVAIPPKLAAAAAALPVGGYIVKPFEAVVVCSHRVPLLPLGADVAAWDGGYRVAPLKDCSTRIHFSDDMTSPEPAAVIWSIILNLSNVNTASDASPSTLTPLVTSRLSTPTDDRSQHPPLPLVAAEQPQQPVGDSAGTALVAGCIARFASTLRQTPLLRTSGSLTAEDRVVHVKLSVPALLTWLGGITTCTALAVDGGDEDASDATLATDSATVSFATVRTDDVSSTITMEVQLRSLDDFLKVRAPAVKLRHIAAVLLHALLPLVEISLCSVTPSTTSPTAASPSGEPGEANGASLKQTTPWPLATGPKSLLVEVEIKCKVEEPEQKTGAKGGKKGAPKPNVPSAADSAAAWSTVIPKCAVGSVVVQPALLAQHVPDGSCVLLRGHPNALFPNLLGCDARPDVHHAKLRPLHALIEHNKVQGVVHIDTEHDQQSRNGDAGTGQLALTMLLRCSDPCCLPAVLEALHGVNPQSSVTSIPCIHLPQDGRMADSRGHSWQLLPFGELSS